LLSDLYLAKLLDTLAKSFFPCTKNLQLFSTTPLIFRSWHLFLSFFVLCRRRCFCPNNKHSPSKELYVANAFCPEMHIFSKFSLFATI